MSVSPEISWTGEVPQCWIIAPLKYSISYNDEVLPESTQPDIELSYVEISDVTASEGIQNVTQLLFGDAPSRARRIAQAGDVLVSTVRTYLRAIAPVEVNSVVASTGFAVLRAGSGLASGYLRYLCLSGPFIESVIARSTGVSYPAINAGDLVQTRVAIPPFEAQTEIVAFLDRETAKIDALIAKQEQLIATLREDRAATITQAVTKGLDPNVEMKDSGLEWAGSIPAKWEVRRMSWLFNSISSGTTPDSKNVSYYGGQVNWVTTGELREGYVEETSSKVTAAALAAHSALNVYESGSLVIAMYGATIGRLGILSAPACTNQACCVFADPNDADVRFMFYVLLAARQHLLVLASGGGQPNINQDKLRALRVPTPPLAVQRAIAVFLDSRCKDVDVLIARSTAMIETLREYRSALITDAVTGKIDVRGVA